MDVKDKKILFELDTNCRQSDTQIAKKVALSKDAVVYRISKLETEGVISAYRLLYDLHKLGLSQYRVALKLVDLTSDHLKQLIAYLKAETKVWVIAHNEGEYDFAFVVTTTTIFEFYEFYESFLESFRSIVGESLITELLEYDEIPRHYLIDKKPPAYHKIKFSSEKVLIDKLDWKIISELRSNSRAKYVDVARKLNISSMLLIQRIKKLEEKNVIIGYKADINVLKLGRDYYGIKIHLRDYSQKEQLLTKIYGLKETTAVIYCVGGYDIEFDVELKNTSEYHALIDSLRNEFSTIREIKSIRAVDYYVGK